MTRDELLLNQVMEEAAEVIVRASKAKRFGLGEVQPGQPLTNGERLGEEMNDLAASYLILQGEGKVPALGADAVEKKQAKVGRYAELSAKLGAVPPAEVMTAGEAEALARFRANAYAPKRPPLGHTMQPDDAVSDLAVLARLAARLCSPRTEDQS